MLRLEKVICGHVSGDSTARPTPCIPLVGCVYACVCVWVFVCVCVHVCLKSDASLTYSNRFAATVCGRRDRHCCCDVLKVVEAFIGTNTFLKRGKDKKGKHVHKKKSGKNTERAESDVRTSGASSETFIVWKRFAVTA